jgi:hypothetical protein
MHDKNLKRFRVLLHDLHSNMDVSVPRQTYPLNAQRASRSVLNKVELFDR